MSLHIAQSRVRLLHSEGLSETKKKGKLDGQKLQQIISFRQLNNTVRCNAKRSIRVGQITNEQNCLDESQVVKHPCVTFVTIS